MNILYTKKQLLKGCVLSKVNVALEKLSSGKKNDKKIDYVEDSNMNEIQANNLFL